jgi:fumarate hydratase subunit alpha
MRCVPTAHISQVVAELCTRANYELPADVVGALEQARRQEGSAQGRWVLEQLLRNAELAGRTHLPLCQDTGLVICFVRLGRQVCLDGDLQQAIDAGVRKAYTHQPLRASMVRDPLQRDSNTGDNTPAVLHVELAEGDQVELQVLIKGGGSENAGAAWMLSPAEGEEGVVERVVAQVRAQGGKWCPPGLLGVGLGGSLEQAALLAKRALMRPPGTPHPETRWAQLERRLLEAVNATGVGPMGLGGDVTALAVHIEYYPCHIACLPVAVNFLCHSIRRAEARI